MKHVMIDLETLGTNPDTIFLSLAAVQFDPNTGMRGEEFCMNVDINSQGGRGFEAGTIRWWLEQRPEIMKKMFTSPSSLTEVRNAFSEFWHKNKLVYPWGNSARFDLGILHNAGFHQWLHYNERDYRTMASLVERLEKDPRKAHDPLYDCQFQIKNLHNVVKALKITI